MRRSAVGLRTFCLLLAMLGVAWHGEALAQASNAVRIQVGAAPGGSIDVYSRIVADHMSATLGRPVIVETKPGANGNVAAAYVVEQPADGSVLWAGTQSMTEINPLVYKNVRWKLADFIPLIKGIEAPMVLVTNPSVPAKTLAELIAWVKANPGKVSYASYSPGTP